MPVILPMAVFGTVHDMVVDSDILGMHSSIRDQPPELVEDRIHVAIPWRWIRAIDVILLRWFPPTPIPKEPQP